MYGSDLWRAAARANTLTGVMFKSRSRHVDEAFRRYLDWRRQSSRCELAYHRWATSADSRDSAIAFAVYTAALDREERAAAHYEVALCGG